MISLRGSKKFRFNNVPHINKMIIYRFFNAEIWLVSTFFILYNIHGYTGCTWVYFWRKIRFLYSRQNRYFWGNCRRLQLMMRIDCGIPCVLCITILRERRWYERLISCLYSLRAVWTCNQDDYKQLDS